MIDERIDRIDAQPVIAPGTSVAVTGATGFIGGRCVARLIEQGAVVTCLVRKPEVNERLRLSGARIVALDITDRDELRTALAGVDMVFHSAFDWHDNAWNFRALDALIDVCSAGACRRFVYLSSFVVYAMPNEGEITEETAAETSSSGYAHTKRQLEDRLLTATHERDLPATILQPTLVYGPESHPFSIEPADKLHFGTVVLPDTGSGICNVVYVDDVVSAMFQAASSDRSIGQRYLISGPSIVTWSEFYEGIARAIGSAGPIYRPASDLARESDRRRRLMRLVTDPERIIRRLANSRPGRNVLEPIIRLLPATIQIEARRRLFAAASQRRGFTHLPSGGNLWFLQCRATVGSQKARRELGYTPQFDFNAGMVPTARYLQERLAG